MLKPNRANRRTGRLPYLSESSPRTGANKNCMPANAMSSPPPYAEASLKPSPVKSLINVGITGMMIPTPMTSTKTVTKMNMIADLPPFMPRMSALISHDDYFESF